MLLTDKQTKRQTNKQTNATENIKMPVRLRLSESDCCHIAIGIAVKKTLCFDLVRTTRWQRK